MSRENDFLDNGQRSPNRDGANAAVESVSVESYAQALDLLYNRIDYERIGHAPYTTNHYRLDRMRQLLTLIGSPQDDYPIIHVAGTKGKGTTATLVCNALRACGIRTGLFTSPHLIRLEERIQFEGKPCSEEQLVALTNTVLNAAIALEARGVGRPTFFELTTAMGFLHASQQAADCLVLEVGLGGRLDSTNVCSPLVCIITSISLDHQAQLGNTIPEIAGEKAGIIKPGIPVICTARDPQARQVFEAVAQKNGSKLHLIDRDFSIQWQPICTSHRLPGSTSSANSRPANTGQTSVDITPTAKMTFNWSDESSLPMSSQVFSQSTEWMTSMLGRHQADNIAGALATLDVLRSQGWTLPIEPVQAAIATCRPPARLQIVSQEPLSIIDTAHNPASIEAAIQAIDDHYAGIPRVIVFASSRDKDYRRMLELLVPKCQHLVLTAYQNNPRALPVAELLSVVDELRGQTPPASMCVEAEMTETESAHAELTGPRQVDHTAGCKVHQAGTPAEAWKLAHCLLTGPQLILATGSFFLAAELLPG